MANGVTVTFKLNKATLSRVQENVTRGMVKMGYAISAQAQRNAPIDTGALVNSIRVTTDRADKVFVLAGGSVGGKNIAYAKKREYENRKNPQTKRYMGRAFDEVTKDYTKYFKGITK